MQRKDKIIVENVMRLLTETKNKLVRKKCIELIPIMYEAMKNVFSEDVLEIAFSKMLEQLTVQES